LEGDAARLDIRPGSLAGDPVKPHSGRRGGTIFIASERPRYILQIFDSFSRNARKGRRRYCSRSAFASRRLRLTKKGMRNEARCHFARVRRHIVRCRLRRRGGMVAQRFDIDLARRLFPLGERKLLGGPLRALRFDHGASWAHRHARERDRSARPPHL
jgi:hypothetical protein